MKVRNAKRFVGNPQVAEYTTVLQYWDGEKWVDVPTEWDTPPDQTRWDQARDWEMKHGYR